MLACARLMVNLLLIVSVLFLTIAVVAPVSLWARTGAWPDLSGVALLRMLGLRPEQFVWGNTLRWLLEFPAMLVPFVIAAFGFLLRHVLDDARTADQESSTFEAEQRKMIDDIERILDLQAHREDPDRRAGAK